MLSFLLVSFLHASGHLVVGVCVTRRPYLSHNHTLSHHLVARSELTAAVPHPFSLAGDLLGRTPATEKALVSPQFRAPVAPRQASAGIEIHTAAAGSLAPVIPRSGYG